MTVTFTSSPRSGSMAAPKTVSASGSTTSAMAWAARCTSCRPRFLPPTTLNRTPRAPWMLTSSSGLVMAARGAAPAAVLAPALPAGGGAEVEGAAARALDADVGGGGGGGGGGGVRGAVLAAALADGEERRPGLA